MCLTRYGVLLTHFHLIITNNSSSLMEVLKLGSLKSMCTCLLVKLDSTRAAWARSVPCAAVPPGYRPWSCALKSIACTDRCRCR